MLSTSLLFLPLGSFDLIFFTFLDVHILASSIKLDATFSAFSRNNVLKKLQHLLKAMWSTDGTDGISPQPSCCNVRQLNQLACLLRQGGALVVLLVMYPKALDKVE